MPTRIGPSLIAAIWLNVMAPGMAKVGETGIALFGKGESNAALI